MRKGIPRIFSYDFHIFSRFYSQFSHKISHPYASLSKEGEIELRLFDYCHLAIYNDNMKNNGSDNLGTIIKQQRVMVPLTLQQLATISGISPSHLGRIERGERFPSARILRKIAEPLGFEENELFALAGYLSPQPSNIADPPPIYASKRLDPYVARCLAQEPMEVQRAVIGILNILKSMASGMVRETR